MSEILYEYQNGNCFIKLYKDGTKERSWPNNELPVVQFPESIDLKITDYCNAGCTFCHEKSTVAGKHANTNWIINKISGLPPGIEIAIGGGNPLDHPDLDLILTYVKNCGLVANITVNQKHVEQSKYYRQIETLRYKQLIWGLGISLTDYKRLLLHKDIIDNNTILHVIAGIHKPFEVLKISKKYKILILGYKQYGFGIKYYTLQPVKKLLEEWNYWLRSILLGRMVSFDNLALEQLNIKNLIGQELWLQHYMGDDGKFTMYIDAVQQQFASSSVNNRFDCNNKSILECFNLLQAGENF